MLTKLNLVMERQEELLRLVRTIAANSVSAKNDCFDVEDVLPKPISSKADFNVFCDKLADAKFVRSVVCYIIYYSH